MSDDLTQESLVREFYIAHPNRPIPHQEAVDWLTETYKQRKGEVFRDPDRAIRKLAQQGFLTKISKGVYLYDPDAVTNRELEDFTPALKRAVIERDNYRCVICGRSKQEGFELHVDHIKPKDQGGRATLENGQTLCSQHNFFKKNYNQTETGKKMFIRLYNLARAENHIELMEFCAEVLAVYEKHNMNGHIVWKKT